MCCSEPGVFTFNLHIYSILIYFTVSLFNSPYKALATGELLIPHSFIGCYPDPPLEFGGMVGGVGLGCVLPTKRCLDKTLAPPSFEIPGYVPGFFVCSFIRMFV